MARSFLLVFFDVVVVVVVLLFVLLFIIFLLTLFIYSFFIFFKKKVVTFQFFQPTLSSVLQSRTLVRRWFKVKNLSCLFLIFILGVS